MAQDIPFLDESVVRLPADIREDLAEKGRNSLFFFNRAVMGYRDLTHGCHGPLCEFADTNQKQFKMMLMPRDHLKTSCISIGGSLQRVVKDVEARTLLGNEAATNAERFLRSIRQHAEGNRIFRALYSDVIPKDYRKVRWNDSELDFNRKGHYPEPSIDSIGMTGAVTSRHYTHITYDDPISEEAVKSDKVMKDTINRMSSALSLLEDPGHDSIWLVGTRWALWDVYSEWQKVFGERLGRLVRAVIEDGEPIWPERFTPEVIALKRQVYGDEYKFSCLMMNNPRNPELQDLNVEDFKFWSWSGEKRVTLYDKNGAEVDRYDLSDLDITCAVDLAPAEKVTSDRNAVTVVGVSAKGQAIVLDAWGKRCTPLEVIQKLFQVHRRFKPRVFGVEDVGYQKAFKYFLRTAAEKANLYFNVVPVKPGGKGKPHIRGLQPLMATGRMFIHPTQHILRNEAADYPLGEHDDVLDSLALHQQLFRNQMSAERWNKYKESERKLLKALKSPTRQVVLADPRKGIMDIEEEEDPEQRIQEVSFV